MRSSFDPKALLTVLQCCRELVSRSEDSDWSCLDAKDIIAILDHTIRRLGESLPIEIDKIRFIFLPTGPLQETSMSNGWANEFLELAKRFDEIIGESS